MNSLLSLVTFLPLIGAVVLLVFLRGEDELAQRNAKLLALFTTTATFLLSLFVLAGFDPSNTGFQFVEERAWLGGLTYKMGVDGISVLFVMLTTFLMPLTIAASWNVTERVKEYMVAFLVLETLMLGVFCALDLVLFYIFFEGGLIPMFLIIGIWGGRDRIYAAFKFFLYTFFGSVLMLVALIAMYWQAGTTDIPTLLTYPFRSETIRVLGFTVVGGAQTLMLLAFFASFAVKMPMWPVHTWLPDAHVQAPTAGSVILAAILLKMGGYGFLRFSLPMFPVASELMATFVFTLSVIAIIYTSLVAMMQEDMKKLIAYSSVAHMGFVTMGIFAINRQGVDGAIFQMLSHGFISGALFLCRRRDLRPDAHPRDRRLRRARGADAGLSRSSSCSSPSATSACPAPRGFVGEFLTLAGVFQVSTWVAFFAATGVILSAGYALWLYRRVVFGDLIKESLKTIQDMDRREKLIFAPLVAAMIFLGVYPALRARHHRPVGRGAGRPHRDGARGLGPDARRELKGRHAMLAEDLTVVAPEARAGGLRDGRADVGRLSPGARSGGRCSGRPACCWSLVGLWIGFQPEGTRTAFDGSFVNDGFARFAKVMILFGAAAALALSHEYLEQGRADEVRVPGADRALGRRHDDHGLGARPDRALHGARAAVARALRRRRLPARLACARPRRG